MLKETPRQETRGRVRRPAAVDAPLAFYAVVLRPRQLTWGATTEETTRAFPP